MTSVCRDRGEKKTNYESIMEAVLGSKKKFLTYNQKRMKEISMSPGRTGILTSVGRGTTSC
jgi:hypothetical protein